MKWVFSGNPKAAHRPDSDYSWKKLHFPMHLHCQCAWCQAEGAYVFVRCRSWALLFFFWRESHVGKKPKLLWVCDLHLPKMYVMCTFFYVTCIQKKSARGLQPKNKVHAIWAFFSGDLHPKEKYV